MSLTCRMTPVITSNGGPAPDSIIITKNLPGPSSKVSATVFEPPDA
jgi:hypothetical protein